MEDYINKVFAYSYPLKSSIFYASLIGMFLISVFYCNFAKGKIIDNELIVGKAAWIDRFLVVSPLIMTVITIVLPVILYFRY